MCYVPRSKNECYIVTVVMVLFLVARIEDNLNVYHWEDIKVKCNGHKKGATVQ